MKLLAIRLTRLITIGVISLVAIGCGGEEPPETDRTNESVYTAATAPIPSTAKPTKERNQLIDAYKKMAATQGVYIGELPDNFPSDVLPLYPGSTIDKAAVQPDGITLLQTAPADKDTVLKWFSDFYEKKGWESADPITVMNRTLTGFNSNGASVDMTVIARDNNETFVALALSLD